MIFWDRRWLLIKERLTRDSIPIVRNDRAHANLSLDLSPFNVCACKQGNKCCVSNTRNALGHNARAHISIYYWNASLPINENVDTPRLTKRGRHCALKLQISLSGLYRAVQYAKEASRSGSTVSRAEGELRTERNRSSNCARDASGEFKKWSFVDACLEREAAEGRADTTKKKRQNAPPSLPCPHYTTSHAKALNSLCF